jgi:hypothetical protein
MYLGRRFVTTSCVTLSCILLDASTAAPRSEFKANTGVVFAEKMATPEREMGAGIRPLKAGKVWLEWQRRRVSLLRPESLRI